MRREVAIFSMFDSIVEGEKHRLNDCRHCCIRADNWRKRVRGEPTGTRSFTSFL